MEAIQKRNNKQMAQTLLTACKQRRKWRGAKNGAVRIYK